MIDNRWNLVIGCVWNELGLPGIGTCIEKSDWGIRRVAYAEAVDGLGNGGCKSQIDSTDDNHLIFLPHCAGVAPTTGRLWVVVALAVIGVVDRDPEK